MTPNPRFYLVVVTAGDASLVANPAVLRGNGLERYGAADDVLATLEPGGSTHAVVAGERVIALGDPRVARGNIEVDGEAATVMVVNPAGDMPAEQLQDVSRWLAQAVLSAGGGWTTTPPTTAGRGGAPAETPRPAEGGRRAVGLAGAALLVGLVIGGFTMSLLTPGGGNTSVDPGPSAAVHNAAGIGGAVRAPAGVTPSAAAPAGTHAVEALAAAPLVAVAAPADVTNSDDSAANLSVAEAGALPALSLWDEVPRAPVAAISAHCNAYGDLTLDVPNGVDMARKTVVCGKFQKKSGRGNIRRSVCVPSLRRCAMLSSIDLSLAPAYICTPLSGRSYGLMKAQRRHGAHYRNGRAQAGIPPEKPAVRTCRRGAQYSKALRRL